MIKCIEHPAIAAALEAAGVSSEPLSNITEAGVFLAWSSRERLLLNPSYAWLSLPAIDYVQLPTSRKFILERLKNLSSLKLDTADDERLFFPVGQWNWAVRQLEICQSA